MREQKVASFLCVKPNLSCHFITLNPDGVVEAIKDVNRSDIRINGGYFVFRKDIFQYMKDGEELLHEPFQRLVEQEQLLAYKYDGFWAAMDTFKDKQMLDDIYAAGAGAVAGLEPFTSTCRLESNEPDDHQSRSEPIR